MTVASQICRVEFNWTGAETVFAPGFGALAKGDVIVTYTPTGGAAVVLVDGQEIQVSIDPASRAVSVVPLGIPAAPGKIRVERRTAALQSVNFVDGLAFSAEIHENLHDAHVFRIQELQSLLADQAALIASLGAVNFAAQPIYRHEAIAALSAHAHLGGTWFSVVQAATPAAEDNPANVLFMAPVWPAGGQQWRNVQAILAVALGGFSDAQRQELELQAYSYRASP